MAEGGRCSGLSELLKLAGQDPEVAVEEPPEPGVTPSFHEWPRQLDMWPLEMLMVEAGWKPLPPIIRVRSVRAVQRVVSEASRLGACLVPRGGGSNVVGSGYPARCCALLDLTGLNRVIEFNPDDLYVHVEAGAYVARLEAWLRERGFTLQYHPQSSDLATIGGSVSMLGSGAYAPGKGNIEDLVLWLDVVLPDGQLVTVGSRSSPRGWEGPGVKHLFMGAEGGLGVIVAAGLRIRPLPRFTVDAAYVLPGLREGLEAAKRLTLWGRPSIVRVVDASESAILYGVEGILLLVRIEGDDEELIRAETDYLDRLARGLGGVRSDELFNAWWDSRLRYDEYTRKLWSMGLWVDTIDTASRWSVMPRLNERLLKELAGVRGVVAVFSHAGHFYPNGGSLYHTVVMERDPRVYWNVWRTAAKIALEEGASLTHQHGFGILRAAWAWEALNGNLGVYCRVKRALDPKRTLASGGLASRCWKV